MSAPDISNPFRPPAIVDPLGGLNDQQRAAAAETEGPVLVLAGAGTGKTLLFVSRIALMVENGVPPSQILAVTFTSKAAKEMRARLAKKIGRARAAQVTMGTFHAVCLKLLKKNPELAHLSEGFAIVDEAQSRGFVRESLAEIGLRLGDDGANAYTLASEDRDLLARVAGTLSAIKDAGITPGTVSDMLPAFLARGEAEKEFAMMAAAVYPFYQARLREENMADFADMILWPTLAMEDDEALRRTWAGRFSHIQVDEYQDTNGLQDTWIELLGRDHRNVMVVGDDSQSIYAFRGAVVENILSFPSRWGQHTRVVRLETNYRCTPAILAAANAVIANNTRRFEKTLTPAPGAASGEPIRVTEADSAWTEARYVMREAARLTARPGGEAASLFVLYRSNFVSRQLEEAAIDQGLEYTLVGDTGFYGRMEVRDALAYLRLMTDPGDTEAFARIANVPARGIGTKTMEAILQAAAVRADRDVVQAGLDLPTSTVKNKNAHAGLLLLQRLQRAWREAGAAPAMLGDRLESLLEDAGYLAHWRDDTDDPKAEERLENLAEVFRVATQSKIPDALFDRARRAAEAERDDAALRLSTIHAAKGLEADFVFCVGFEEGLLPSRHAVEREQAGDVRGIEQERNLAYVALTRARTRLYVTWTPARLMGAVQSRFLDEIPVTATHDGKEMMLRVDVHPESNRVPTEKQLAYARTLAADRKIPLPAEAEESALACSAFIERLTAASAAQ